MEIFKQLAKVAEKLSITDFNKDYLNTALEAERYNQLLDKIHLCEDPNKKLLMIDYLAGTLTILPELVSSDIHNNQALNFNEINTKELAQRILGNMENALSHINSGEQDASLSQITHFNNRFITEEHKDFLEYYIRYIRERFLNNKELPNGKQMGRDLKYEDFR